jgi:hypothetical protein
MQRPAALAASGAALPVSPLQRRTAAYGSSLQRWVGGTRTQTLVRSTPVDKEDIEVLSERRYNQLHVSNLRRDLEGHCVFNNEKKVTESTLTENGIVHTSEYKRTWNGVARLEVTKTDAGKIMLRIARPAEAPIEFDGISTEEAAHLGRRFLQLSGEASSHGEPVRKTVRRADGDAEGPQSPQQ